MDSYQVRDLPQGRWLSDYRRYFEYASFCLGDLCTLVAELRALRAPDAPPTLSPNEITDDIRLRYRRRDALSDSVKVFSAMSVEAYLNLYGVMRLGEMQYAKLERLGGSRKLAELLRICDKVDVKAFPSLKDAVEVLFDRRDSLVHPKAKELPLATDRERLGDPVPDVAVDCFRCYEEVFLTFPKAAPQAMDLLL